MANRRMFSKDVVFTDDFLDMPISCKFLYFMLGMWADDDGFIDSPKSVLRQCGATTDDMNVLIAKRYVIQFDNGIIVIRHWRMNNYLRQDRYKATVHAEEKAFLELKENEYELVTQRYTTGIPTVNPGKVSIEKGSIVEDSIDINNINKTDNTTYNPPIVPPMGNKGKAQESENKQKKITAMDLLAEKAFPPELDNAVREWSLYKKERGNVYKITGFKQLLTQIENKVREYGVDAVIEVIRLSMAQNWQGITWDKLGREIGRTKKTGTGQYVITQEELGESL